MSSDTNNQEEATEIENEKNVAETSELVEKKVIKEEKKNIVLTKKQSTIFNIIASENITIAFVIVKYIDSNP